MKKNFIMLVLVIFLFGCHNEGHEKNREFEQIVAQNLKFDLVFPEPLWDLILHSIPKNTINANKSVYDIFDSLPMNVQLIENHANVFDGKNYQFDFKDFGGEINWANYFSKAESGGFTVKFNFPKKEEGEMHVFFMSWSKSFKKDDEQWGGGCNTILDVTNYFKKTVFKKGLLLHTKDSRYFYVTAGRLYFVFYGKEKIKLAQVTFTDSNLKNKMCENIL